MPTPPLHRTRKHPLQTALLFFVLSTHLIFLCILLVSSPRSPPKKKHKQLLVKTITTTPRTGYQTTTHTHTPKTTPEKSRAQKSTAVPKEAQKPPLPTAKKPTVKSSPPVKKETVKQPHPQNKTIIDDTLLQELAESIAKIEANSDKPTINKSTSITKKSVAPMALQVDLINSSHEGTNDTYTDRLVQSLHRQLKLPEYGEVNIQLSLHQDGTIAKIVVLSTQSEKNRRYLENALLHIKLPSLQGACAEESVFVLTFCNERIK